MNQMLIYRLQRIVKRIGCTDEVRNNLGPESGVEHHLQGSPEADEIWHESLKPIQEACAEEE